MLNRGVAGFREWHRTTEPGPTDSGVRRTSGRSPDRAGSYGRVAGQLGRGLQIQGFVGPLGGRRTEPAPTGGSTGRAGAYGRVAGQQGRAYRFWGSSDLWEVAGQSRLLREGRRTTGPGPTDSGARRTSGRRTEPAPTGGSPDNRAWAYRFRGSSDLWEVAGQSRLLREGRRTTGPGRPDSGRMIRHRSAELDSSADMARHSPGVWPPPRAGGDGGPPGLRLPAGCELAVAASRKNAHDATT